MAVVNPPGLPEIAFRTGTHGGFLSSLLARLSSPAYPELAGLTVRSTDDPAIALLDAWAVVADLLSFYTERIANEGYLRTVTEDGSLALLGRLVGHVPRPGVAAGTYLAYALDRDPRGGADTAVTIPRGARAQSVPGPGEEPQPFELLEELPARWTWNDLKVRVRRPYQVALAPDRTVDRRTVHFAGAGNNLKPGDPLLFVFGTGQDRQALDVVQQVRIDQDNDLTVVTLPGPALPDFDALIARLADLVDAARRDKMYGRSRIVARFVDDVLKAQATDPVPTTPAGLLRALDEVIARLVEAMALAQPYKNVHGWFLTYLLPKVGALRDAAAMLEPPQPENETGPGPETERPDGRPQSLYTALSLDRVVGKPAPGSDSDTDEGEEGDGDGNGAAPPTAPPSPAVAGLGALLGSLRLPPTRPPLSPRDLIRDPSEIYAPGSDLGAQLLAALDPRLRDGLYAAWRRVDLTAPLALADVQAMRIVATPFGATAPLKPDYDEQGRLLGYTDWPLRGNQVLDLRIVYDEDGQVPERAVFTWAESSGTARTEANLDEDTEFEFGPGHVGIEIHPAPAPPDPDDPPPDPDDPQQKVGVTVTFSENLPHRSVFVARPNESGRVLVTIEGDDPGEIPEPLSPELWPDDTQVIANGAQQVTLRRTPERDGANASVEVSFAASLALSSRNVLALDAVYDGIGQGTWVVVQRPRKDSGEGDPGDGPLDEVVTRVRAARVVSRADFGITGKVTELTLDDDWLDARDTMLSHIRDTTVYVRGESVAPATEPIDDDVEGGSIELAELYEGLSPGRWIIVTGERTDVPGTGGLTGTELAMIAAVRQVVDPSRPGEAVHTTITLASELAYRYRRETVHVYANVGRATQGATRDEPIGSGDASVGGQTFRLFQGPLTWLAADNPLGAQSTLEVRVGGVLWREVDSLAGRGPDERVYVTRVETDGRTSVTFGDGVHGARLPTGHENIRAVYRVGIGPAGNVAAGKITQLLTRPLWVSGVDNPLPATGGAAPDDAAQARRGIPLSVTALDRLVSVPDYEDFARARAGIGRASATRLYDGRREGVHVTVAGVGDIPLADDSDIVRTLRSAFAEHGDPQLPVTVAVRELVLLVVAARIRVHPDHSYELVEPRVRAALLDRLGFARRELGQPAYLSEVIAAVQAVPGVDHVDVDVFGGVPASITPAGLGHLAGTLTEPAPVVPARLAVYDVARYTVTATDGETLTAVAAAHGITVAELLRLNPDITDVTRLPAGRTVVVFRGVRPAQLVMASPAVPDTLILTEAR
ncbi:putative baseplate assembly protein [Actinomadura sp. HBU206391]|uniref:putative baseplate assembly protein n=1 Tax=Actinomadura sp. HBU206391 TaxID=2731692 RepID=UPI001C9D3172|nr:putative baseplate assembly protein [Actinomadura sp. HBU206391]